MTIKKDEQSLIIVSLGTSQTGGGGSQLQNKIAIIFLSQFDEASIEDTSFRLLKGGAY